LYKNRVSVFNNIDVEVKPVFVPPPIEKPKNVVHEEKPVKIPKTITNRLEGSQTAKTKSEQGAVGAPAPAQPM
jgi:5,10-methylenetetrahydrofolate reductase